MRILLTGADGMLGSNLTRVLLERGHEVNAFLFSGSKSKTLDGLPIKKVFGNILNREELEKATQGCDAFVHCAANTNIWPNRSEMVRKVNIDGTRNAIQAAQSAKVKRFIFIGTANSFGFGSKAEPGNEGRPYISDQYGLDYMDSKYEAQKLVLEACKDGLPGLTINPTFMLGPYDSKPGAGAMVLAIYNQKVPGFAVGGRNYIYVKDVAVAIANALTKGKVGESYIAGNQNMDYKEAFTLIANVVGVKPPKITIPPFASKAFGYLSTKVANLSGGAPTVSYTMAKISCDEHYFTAKKAVRELELPQTDVNIAVKESFEWLRDNGYCN